jgi:hypothetical protein
MAIKISGVSVIDDNRNIVNINEIDSPKLVGAPTAPTPLSGSSGDSIATTEFVSTAINEVDTDIKSLRKKRSAYYFGLN